MDVGACNAEADLPLCRTEATRGLLTPQSRRKRTPEDAHHLDSIPETTEKPPRTALADDPSTVRQPNFGTQLNTRCDAKHASAAHLLGLVGRKVWSQIMYLPREVHYVGTCWSCWQILVALPLS